LDSDVNVELTRNGELYYFENYDEEVSKWQGWITEGISSETSITADAFTGNIYLSSYTSANNEHMDNV
jgi:hypothetical protein